MEWQKVSNTRLRCLRITSKEEKAVRSKLQVRSLQVRGMRAPSRASCAYVKTWSLRGGGVGWGSQHELLYTVRPEA